MRRLLRRFFIPLVILGASIPEAAPCIPAKEFLTPEEITKVQEAREVDRRVKIYLEAAALRLKTAEDRFNGRESAPGDPLEFFSVAEMLEGYYRILRSVMFNMDEAVQSPATDRSKLGKALKDLKARTERAAKDLEILKKLAEEKQQEEIWNLVNRAIEITDGAHDGAQLGLSRLPEKSKPKD